MTQMMSVYRQHAAPFPMEMRAILAVANSEDEMNLIVTSLTSGRPVLIGLDNLPTIIKPVAEGNEALSFDALYDTCLTKVDLDKMRRAGVSSPDEVPLEAYSVTLDVELDEICKVSLALFADNPGDVPGRFHGLYAKDVMFREAFFDQIINALDRKLRAGRCSLRFAVLDSTSNTHEPIEPPMVALPEGPAWRFNDE